MTERKRLNRTATGELACLFGEPWLGPHPLCEAEVERILAKARNDPSELPAQGADLGVRKR